MKKKLLTNILLSSAASTGTAVQKGLHPDPGSIYLANIKAGKYSIRPAGENRATVSVKIGGTDSTTRSVKTGLRPVSKANGNGNSGNNGPQSEGDVDQVWVNIKEIEFLSESGGKTTVSTTSQSVDLIAAKTNASFLFHKAVIPEGKYKEIRLILDDNNGKIVKQGLEYSLKVPSGAQSGLKLKGDIDMVSGLLIELALDFKYESLKYTPGQGYILSPVMNILSSKALLPFVHGMLIVKFKNQTNVSNSGIGTLTGIASVDAILQRYQAVYARQLIVGMPNMDLAVARDVGLDRVYLMYFRQNQDVLLAMFDLKMDSNIELASPNHLMNSTETVPNDPAANKNGTGNKNQVTYLNAINAYNGWDITAGNAQIKIAVIDTGVEDRHEDLTGRVIQNRSFYDETNCVFNCLRHRADSRPQTLSHWHGTHVAGIIGAAANNSKGGAGINWNSKILAINVFNDRLNAKGLPETTEGLAATGIIEAANNGANVINLSLGGYGFAYTIGSHPMILVHTHPLEFGAVEYAYAKNVFIVAAAGNDSRHVETFPGTPFTDSSQGHFPSSFAKVVSVSALTETGSQFDSSYSNYGKVDISAPGTSIFSAYTFTGSSTYALATGTSMAAPMVSAFAGLIKSLQPNLSPSAVLNKMCEKATKLSVNSDPILNQKYVGCGRINLGETLGFLNTSPAITNNCGGALEPYCAAGNWGNSFTFQFTATGGTAPYRWEKTSGDLPPNTNLDSNTGILSGGPTYWFGPGWTFTVKVTDSNGNFSTKTVYFQSNP